MVSIRNSETEESFEVVSTAAVRNTDSPLLEVKRLSVRFAEKQVLKDLSLTVRAGEKLVVRGASGSGKSTLLRCLLGFLAPQSGSIFIGGTILNERTVWLLRRRIGYVPQEPDMGAGTARDLLARPLGYRANRMLDRDPERILSLCRTFHLDERLLEENLSTLSGGEKQRVALISSLLLDRDLYLLDEATSALDEKAKNSVIQYFKQQKELTLIAVTHDRSFLGLSDRVLSLDSKGEASR